MKIVNTEAIWGGKMVEENTLVGHLGGQSEDVRGRWNEMYTRHAGRRFQSVNAGMYCTSNLDVK